MIIFWNLILCLSAMVPRGITQSPNAGFSRRYKFVRGSRGLLLLLSLLHTNQSAHIVAIQKMATLGEDALTYLEKAAASALRNHTGSHKVGCIKEAKQHEHLSCNLISTFSSYFQEAADLKGLDKELRNKLKAIIQNVEDLKYTKCSNQLTTCEAAFQGTKNLEKLRSLLVLFKHWIVKPLE